MKTSRRLAGLLAPLVLVAACSSAGGTGSPTGGGGAVPGTAAPNAAPSQDDGTTTGPDQPVGTGLPHVEPGPGGATFVSPKPGQLDVHPVRMDSIAASVDGRHVVVTATWWSGVEPCSTLDSIVVARGDGTVTITLREGSTNRMVACIDIAQLKGTRIDLGDLEPGTYRISDGGGDVSTQVVVS
jgi:hypothetical protein